MLKRVLAGVAVAVMLAGTAVAGPIEDGQAAYGRGDYATALELWRPLAEQGNASAQLHVGYMYEHGWGVPQDDAEAVKWWQLAAEQGNALAQYELGRVAAKQGDALEDATAAYERGDYRRLVSLANKRDDPAAPMYFLGRMHADGVGAPQDYAQAHMFFNIAAALGYEDAAEKRDDVQQYMGDCQLAEAHRLGRDVWDRMKP